MKKEVEWKQEHLKERILDIIGSLEGIHTLHENPILKEELSSLKKRAKDQFFKVAVVGEFSSGKSTFINALMGKDLLKHGAKETTATLTRIINVEESHPLHGKCKVVFRGGQEEILDTLEEITTYTTTSSERHKVSQEIESVEIYLHFLDTDIPVMIIDTPGLNGMAENHREQTILQLKEAHACIYLLQLRGLSQSDKDFIRFIMHYQHDFIFLQNFIDELKELEGETVESKLRKQDEILKGEVFLENDTVRYELCGISSRNALLAREASSGQCSASGEGPLDDIARRKLLKSSNFDNVLAVLKRLMKENHKGRVQQRSVMEHLLQFLDYAEGLLQVEEESLAALWQESDEENMRLKTALVRDRLLAQQKDHVKKLEHFVYARVHELQRFTRRKITDALTHLETDIKGRIKALPTLYALEEFMDSHEMEKYFAKKIPAVEKDYMAYLEAGFQDILCNAVLRIHDYTGGRKTLRAVPRFQVQCPSHEVQKFTSEEDNLKRINREIAELAAEERKTDLEILRIQKEKEKDARAYEKVKEESLRVAEEYVRRDRNIGAMPPKEMTKARKTVRVSHKRKHRYLGKFMDFFLGEDTITVTEPVEVNTGQNQWQEKKRKLMLEQKNRQEDLDNQLAELERRMSQQQRTEKMLEQTREMKVKRMESLEKLYTSTRESLETKKNVALTEYMELIRKSLYERIHGYLYEEENIEAYFQEHAMAHAALHREKLLKKVLIFYEGALEERLKRYEALLVEMPQTERPDLQTQQMEMKKYKNELEECLCQLL